MSSKKSKGKQKISIKKIDKDEDRMVTLAKRRSGIYTKLSELSVLCGADVGFLVYSGAGKPYTFGSPSFGAVAERFFNGNSSSSLSSSSIVEAHRKVMIGELCRLYDSTVEKVDAEEDKMVTAAESSTLPVPKDAWWKANPEGVKDDEEVRKLMEMYEGFYEKLSEEIARRSHGSGGDASSSLAGKNRHG